MRPRNKDTENLEARHRRRRECSSPDLSADPVTSSCISVQSSESECCSAKEDKSQVLREKRRIENGKALGRRQATERDRKKDGRETEFRESGGSEHHSGGGDAWKHRDANTHERTNKVPLPRDRGKVYPREGDYDVDSETRHRGDAGVTSTPSTHFTAANGIAGRSISSIPVMTPGDTESGCMSLKTPATPVCVSLSDSLSLAHPSVLDKLKKLWVSALSPASDLFLSLSLSLSDTELPLHACRGLKQCSSRHHTITVSKQPARTLKAITT